MLSRMRKNQKYESLPKSDLEINGEGVLQLTAGAYFLPKVNEDKPLGEDAYFICNHKQTIGVADGVGSYAKYGIDSGVYADELMNSACEFVKYHSSKGSVDPMTVLKHAFEKSDADGASTACIITVKDNTLHAVNIGDSGFRVIRQGKIVYKSRAQQKHFNCPFQLGHLSEDKPSDADEITFKVECGDVIVAATDGLFDNLFDSMIEEAVKISLEAGHPPKKMARMLGKVSRKMSFLRNWASPFTKEAIRNGRDMDRYLGGKYDDVTVIVGYIEACTIGRSIWNFTSLLFYSLFHA